jgi:hypothetical protein
MRQFAIVRVGEVYGHWTVAETGPANLALVRCACGTERRIPRNGLASGHSRSCGCAKLSTVVGSRYGRLTVLELVVPSMARCACDCGTETVVDRGNMRAGRTTSCGCLRLERSAEASRTHGLTKTREYRIWTGLITRCENPRVRCFPRYGGRGIKVCDRWRGQDGFPNFLADMGRRPSPQHSVDRKDSNGDYTPDNCRWATPDQQAQNTRANVLSEEKAAEIRRLFADGIKPRAIASRMGASVPTVRDVINNRSWKLAA